VAWKKSPPELVELFDRVRPEDPRAERRQMFGYPACFVNGNLFASLFEDHVILRLGDKHRAELAKLGGAPFEPMKGRPMTGYLMAPPRLVADEAALRKWVARALDFGAGLPPKAAKKKKK